MGEKFWGEGPDVTAAGSPRFPDSAVKIPAFYAEGDTYACQDELPPNYLHLKVGSRGVENEMKAEFDDEQGMFEEKAAMGLV